MTQKKRRNYMARADKAFARYIRERDGQCLADGPHAGSLQCAHIISRSYKSIRTVPENAVGLCAKHHMFFTHHPLEWKLWVEERYPGLWDDLTKAALSYERVDWKAEAVFYEDQISV